jgi:hypothetical protein
MWNVAYLTAVFVVWLMALIVGLVGIKAFHKEYFKEYHKNQRVALWPVGRSRNADFD